ncbi:MAG: 4-hydroxythreonine-4-phosphate dehydrogenase PdxA [Ignavibacteriales bacterium]|nr:4-hydroxythreonine-4-phosphate dehydrogenase PdxA [Ignavibacteriales bacterium]
MKRKPIIGITMGDFNGIGPEVALKTVTSPKVKKICNPILIGSTDVFEYYSSLLKLQIELRETVPPFRQLKTNEVAIYNPWNFQIPKINIGNVRKDAGKFSGEAITNAVDLWNNGAIDGIVTAPVSKEAMKSGGNNFPGQTEMIASLTSSEKFMMMLLAGTFRVGLATIHVPVKMVASLLSQKVVSEKLFLLHHSLKNDFGITSPRIAVLGLNPHAGENGNIGDEEIRNIIPAVKQSKRMKMKVEGPFPADGFFGKHLYKKYDAVLAMYHDQGLIPLKMQGFDIGVNFTAGLQIVRTSPDHGTAFDIAGRGIANPSSMIEAIKLAVSIIHNRKSQRPVRKKNEHSI